MPFDEGGRIPACGSCRLARLATATSSSLPACRRARHLVTPPRLELVATPRARPRVLELGLAASPPASSPSSSLAVVVAEPRPEIQPAREVPATERAAAMRLATPAVPPRHRLAVLLEAIRAVGHRLDRPHRVTVHGRVITPIHLRPCLRGSFGGGRGGIRRPYRRGGVLDDCSCLGCGVRGDGAVEGGEAFEGEALAFPCVDK